jgi:O-antigen/teichoic acid export membrane protein
VGETLGLTVALVLPLEFALMIVPEQALVALLPDWYAPGAPALRLLAVGNALLILVGVLPRVPGDRPGEGSGLIPSWR